MKFAAAYNVTDQPVAVDDDGHIIDGHGWRAVRHQTQLVRDHIDAGRLVVHTSLEESDGMTAEARAVVREVADLNGSDDTPEPDAAEPAPATRKRTSKES